MPCHACAVTLWEACSSQHKPTPSPLFTTTPDSAPAPAPQVARCENEDWSNPSSELYALCSGIYGTEDADNMEWRDMGSFEDWQQVRVCERWQD